MYTNSSNVLCNIHVYNYHDLCNHYININEFYYNNIYFISDSVRYHATIKLVNISAILNENLNEFLQQKILKYVSTHPFNCTCATQLKQIIESIIMCTTVKVGIFLDQKKHDNRGVCVIHILVICNAYCLIARIHNYHNRL